MYPKYTRTRRSLRIKRRRLRFLLSLRNILIMAIIALCLFIYKMNRSHEDFVIANISKNALKFIYPDEEAHIKAYNTNVIKSLIDKHNFEQNILNTDTYGILNKQSIILVILVDEYAASFKYLLASLSQLRGIENTLLIFSHSYFDDKVNKLITQIDFCRVLQVFYPYSLQLYSDQFPGYDRLDCPADMDIASAESMNCTGAWSPDIHGHYRNPLNAAKKHHWWWTANKVFENLSCTINHNGLVVFLEQDFYFLDDFLYMALYMKKIAETLSQCEFISLGTSSTETFDFANTYGVEVTTWDPKEHSKVLAFDYKVWNSIVSHYDLFCFLDDYSWARSLYFVSLSRRDGKRFKVLHSTTPRAYMIATSTLSTLSDFEMIENIYQVMSLKNKHSKDWFPLHIEVYYNIELEYDEYMIFEYSENNGGWNDPRDKAMCINTTVKKIKKVIMDMKNEFKDYISEKYP